MPPTATPPPSRIEIQPSGCWAWLGPHDRDGFPDGNPPGVIVMQARTALALLDAVEALNALMSGIEYCGEPASDVDIEKARAALARFDFGNDT